MATRKYLKFGLRADKDLSDLTNSKIAVDNILNNLASGSNVFGQAYTFSSDDISPIRELSSTDLQDIIDPVDNLPKILTDMEGSISKYSADAVPDDPKSGFQNIQPQVTLQDHLNRFKVVFGSPPFIAGGSGPTSDFIHSSRLTTITGDIDNFTINLTPTTNARNDLVIGNRYKILDKGDITDSQWDSVAVVDAGSYSDGDVFVCDQTVATVIGANTTAVVRDVSTPSANYTSAIQAIQPNDLPSDKLFTRVVSTLLPNIETSGSAWTNGYFTYTAGIDQGFDNNVGAVQHTGYQVDQFSPEIETNGLMIIEEDVVDTPGDDTNWRFIRGTNSSTVIPTYNVTWLTNSIGLTEITFTNIEDWRKVAKYMQCSIGGQSAGMVESTTTSNGIYRVILDADFGTVESSGTTDLEFTYVVGGDDYICYDKLDFTTPRGDFRRKVRYTVWWPEGTPNGTKVFGRKTDSGYDFGFLNFYKIQLDEVFVTQRYSFPYFRDNRANILRQQGSTELRIDTKFLNLYQKNGADKNIAENTSIFPDTISPSYNTISSITISVDTGGKVIAEEEGTFLNAEVGDFIVSSRDAHTGNGQKYYANQIVQKSSNTRVYIDKLYVTQTLVPSETPHKAFLVKNNGLIGIYKSYDTSGDITIERLDGNNEHAVYPFEVEKDTIVYKIDDGPFIDTDNGDGTFSLSTATTHNTHRYGFRVTSVGHGNSISATSSELTVEAHPSDSGATVSTNNGVMIVYASKGLIDRSTVQECTDVFGQELAVNANPGQNSLTLKSTTGVSVGQYVYFDGAIPYGDPDDTATGFPTMTRVMTVNHSTKVITLGRGGSDVNGGLTIAVNLTAPLSVGATVVFVPFDSGPDSDGWGRQNKEYCVIPLNTAPPWEGTDLGLASPAVSAVENYGVMTKDFRVVALSIITPDVNIEELASSSYGGDRVRYMKIKYTPPVS